MVDEGKLIYKSGSGADAGKLCYKASGVDLGKLCYKAAPVVIGGDITITVVSAQAQVGPIETCTNIHDVQITLDGTSAVAKVSKNFAPASRSVAVATATACAYPSENPPMDMLIVAVQPSTGVVKSASHTVACVATGSFTIAIAVGANGWLTGLGVS